MGLTRKQQQNLHRKRLRALRKVEDILVNRINDDAGNNSLYSEHRILSIVQNALKVKK